MSTTGKWLADYAQKELLGLMEHHGFSTCTQLVASTGGQRRDYVRYLSELVGRHVVDMAACDLRKREAV